MFYAVEMLNALPYVSHPPMTLLADQSQGLTSWTPSEMFVTVLSLSLSPSFYVIPHSPVGRGVLPSSLFSLGDALLPSLFWQH